MRVDRLIPAGCEASFAAEPVQYRLLFRVITHDGLSLVAALQAIERGYHFRIPKTSARRFLQRYGIRSYSVVKKPLLTQSTRLLRRNFCEQMLADPQRYFSVCFSDESLIRLDSASRRVWVSRMQPERRYTGAVAHSISVMVFGAISSAAGAAPLHVFPEGSVTANEYLDVLRDVVQPFLAAAAARGHDLIFQQDNCAIHCTAEVRAVLGGMRTLGLWPAHSPDISPVEKVWALLKTQLKPALVGVTTRDELADAARRVWREIVEERGLLRSLYQHVARHMVQVVAADGGNLMRD